MRRLLLVTFASGFAALTYELVWLSVLSTVVGGTTAAAAATLAVFFLGLGLGSAAGARIVRRVAAPLRVCVAVEFGIALCAGAFLLLLGPIGTLYRGLFASVGHGATLVIALVLLLPPATLMGLTLPLVAEAFVRNPDELGRKGSLIYASNTLGGACGAALSGFWLIAEWGVPWTCALAALLNVGAAVGLLTTVAEKPSREEPERPGAAVPTLPIIIAGASGFLMLALEVLWTRMMVQVVHQSAYTFGAVLLVFLVSLGLASWLVSYGVRFRRVREAPRRTIALVALLATGAVVWSAHIFHPLTNGYEEMHVNGGFAPYILRVLLVSAGTFLPAATVAGMLFPLSLQLAGDSARSGGAGVGVLGATNTLAAIAGSLVGGFVLVQSPFGLFDGLAWVAVAYALVALFTMDGRGARVHLFRLGIVAAGSIAVFLTVGLPPPLALPRGARLLDLHQGVDGIVAVTEKRGDRGIKINNTYTLGSSRATRYQRRQAHVPLLLHPKPKNVLFIGLGSGLTADAALAHKAVDTLTVVELSDDVVDLASEHFAQYARALYSSPRAEIVAADARHYLATDESKYDVIVGDLFVPWRAGVGNLYSREHFQTVQSRLSPGGLFAQWVPLYQMSRREVAVVARTMLSVFSEVSFWRCEFEPTRSILALVVRKAGGERFPPSRVAARVDAFSSRHPTPMWMRGYGLYELYVGTVHATGSLFADAPVNTDQHPVISYQAARTQRAVMGGEAEWVSGAGYLQLLEEIGEQPDDFLDVEAKKHKRAGHLYHETKIRGSLREYAESRRVHEEYRQLRGKSETAGPR